jgi:hypothetical protein
MRCRQTIFLLTALAVIASLVACGGSSKTTPPPPVVSIAASSGGGQSATVGTAFAAPLVATVTTGGSPTSGASVTFTAPASGASGTFGNGTATETDTTDASGVATSTTFTANATIGAYAVTATVAGASGAANFSLTDVVATTLANGTYVFTLTGEDQFANLGSSCVSAVNTACGPYFVAGAFVVSGGTITGGEQDFIDLGIFKSDPIIGGGVSTAADGNLQITLTTADTQIGVSGVETLSGSLVSASTGVITEFDSSATSSGLLARQTSSIAAPSGGYAFATAGVDGSSLPVAIGGVINVDGSGKISGAGSVFDINDDGTVKQAQSFAPSTVSAPDTFGRVQFNLVPSAAVAAINLVGYIVGPKHIWLVETGDTFSGSMGGEALGQGANTGTFNSASFTSFVFDTSGVDNLVATVGAFQVAGLLTATSSSAVSGTLNFNDLTGTGVQSPIPVTGTYTVDTTGRVTLSNLNGSGFANATIQIYLSGNGDGTVASMDTSDVLAGLANEQTGGGSFTASSFSGLYAMNATGFDFNNELEFDANGLVSADGVSGLAGTVDLNFMVPPGTQAPGVSISGAFTANATGVFTGTVAGLDIDTPANNDAFTFYMVDTTKAVAIETDPNQLTLIRFGLQQ